MIARMIGMDDTRESQATELCRSCGLCCTGHLFLWVKLKPSELDPAEELGLHVCRSEPSHRGFSQPCPLWKGDCTIYHSSHYPRACRAFKCKLLKELLNEIVSLPEAVRVVGEAKQMVREMEAILPAAETANFRERLVAQIEHPDETAWKNHSYTEFKAQAGALLAFFEQNFGVNDFFD